MKMVWHGENHENETKIRTKWIENQTNLGSGKICYGMGKIRKNLLISTFLEFDQEIGEHKYIFGNVFLQGNGKLF